MRSSSRKSGGLYFLSRGNGERNRQDTVAIGADLDDAFIANAKGGEDVVVGAGDDFIAVDAWLGRDEICLRTDQCNINTHSKTVGNPEFNGVGRSKFFSQCTQG